MRRASSKPESQGRELSLTAKARLILAAAWVAATVGIVIVQSAIASRTLFMLPKCTQSDTFE
jgi:hypothetical protein